MFSLSSDLMPVHCHFLFHLEKNVRRVLKPFACCRRSLGTLFFSPVYSFCYCSLPQLDCLLVNRLWWKEGMEDGACSPGSRKAVSKAQEHARCVWPPASYSPGRAWHKVQARGSAPGNLEFTLTVLWPWVSSYNVIPFHFPICKKVWKILTPYGGLNV